MSSFICSKCNVSNIDTNEGYIAGCNHFPPEKPTGNKFIIKLRDTSKEIKTFQQLKKVTSDYIWNEIKNDKELQSKTFK